MTLGKLILLNGGSSAGKTSLGKALQDLFDEPYLLLGIDVFWMAMPPRALDLDRVPPEYYTWREIRENNLTYFEVQPGPLLDRTMAARYRATAAYPDAGLNVIADEVLWKREWLEDALRVFAPYEVTFIGVRVSDKEGARREEVRGDRHIGWNRGSARAAHRWPVYDFEIDTTHDTPRVCARRVKDALDAGPKPSAFARLRETLS